MKNSQRNKNISLLLVCHPTNLNLNLLKLMRKSSGDIIFVNSTDEDLSNPAVTPTAGNLSGWKPTCTACGANGLMT